MHKLKLFFFGIVSFFIYSSAASLLQRDKEKLKDLAFQVCQPGDANSSPQRIDRWQQLLDSTTDIDQLLKDISRLKLDQCYHILDQFLIKSEARYRLAKLEKDQALKEKYFVAAIKTMQQRSQFCYQVVKKKNLAVEDVLWWFTEAQENLTLLTDRLKTEISSSDQNSPLQQQLLKEQQITQAQWIKLCDQMQKNIQQLTKKTEQRTKTEYKAELAKPADEPKKKVPVASDLEPVVVPTELSCAVPITTDQIKLETFTKMLQQNRKVSSQLLDQLSLKEVKASRKSSLLTLGVSFGCLLLGVCLKLIRNAKEKTKKALADYDQDSD